MGNLLAREKKNQTNCLGLTFVRLLTASCTNNSRGKHVKLSIIIVEVLEHVLLLKSHLLTLLLYMYLQYRSNDLPKRICPD